MRLSALVQSLAHPFFWSRAEYAARKAQSLIEELDMPRILEHIQHNIEKVSDLASHVDEIYVADLAEQSNRRATLLSVVLAAVSLTLVVLMIPSFLQDLTQFFDPDKKGLYIFLAGICALPQIVFSAWMLFKTFRRPRRIFSIINELLD
jgi:hypothetical protein